MNENIGRMAWYAECMERALTEVRNFTPPARDMRFHHSLFIANLMSLIDLSSEIFGPTLNTAWIESMDGIGGFSGDNNSSYLRELRNAAVHRGFDIASSGVVVENRVLANAPPEMRDRFDKKGPFKAFAGTLYEIFEVSRSKAADVILRFSGPVFEAIGNFDLDEMRGKYLEELEASTLMPDFAKKLARDTVHEIPFDGVRSHNSNRLRQLLS